MNSPRVREAFLSFAAWLVVDEVGLPRRVRRLREHVKFFVSLDRLGEVTWTGDVLLKHFGPAMLRRFELPVRWFELQGQVTLSDEDKQREADLRRIREAVLQLPPNTVAFRLVEGFIEELLKRHAAGELSARSVRLALRPAISLLEVEDPSGCRMPGQAALDLYLQRVPGQRAAVSTFLGYLRASQCLDLRLPAKRTSTAVRRALEQQIEALVLESRQKVVLEERWIGLALRYFHRLSTAEARAIRSSAVVVEANDGLELHFEGRVYWVPKQPVLYNPSLER